MNAKFLRNGIVMLVLVAGTVALLYTWVTSIDPVHQRRATRTSSGTSRTARCRRSSRTARPLTVTPTGGGTPYTVIVQNPITGNVLDDMIAAANAGNQTAAG